MLAQQNMNEELHPASITKVMTLGLACEKAQGKWDNVKLTAVSYTHLSSGVCYLKKKKLQLLP